MQVLHTCDIKCCVNPEHLYIGDGFDNANDAVVRKQNFKAAQTECLRGHPLSGDNLKVRNGKRICLACVKIKNDYWNNVNKGSGRNQCA